MSRESRELVKTLPARMPRAISSSRAALAGRAADVPEFGCAAPGGPAGLSGEGPCARLSEGRGTGCRDEQ
eukprot:2537948-Alexandrium_andersonii.AAC.1